MALIRTALRRRWSLMLGGTLAAMIAGGLFQLLRPSTYVAVATVDIAPAVVSEAPNALADALEAESSYVTAPEVVAASKAALTPGTWEEVRTVKVRPSDGLLRIAVSSYDPAIATDASSMIAAQYAVFLSARMTDVATSQRGAIDAAIERQVANLVTVNDRLSELALEERAAEVPTPQVATLLADRQVTLELVTELQDRLRLLEQIEPARVIDVTAAEASAARLGLMRIAQLGVAMLLLTAIGAVALEPIGEVRAVRRERRTIDLRREQVIDLRDAETLIRNTPRRPL